MRRPPGVTFSNLIEEFHDNGNWALNGTRVPGAGLWSIRRDLLCVSRELMPEREFCRRVRVGVAGEYFIQDAEGPAMEAIQPIDIRPPPTPRPVRAPSQSERR